jgi:hypothetical protein
MATAVVNAPRAVNTPVLAWPAPAAPARPANTPSTAPVAAPLADATQHPQAAPSQEAANAAPTALRRRHAGRRDAVDADSARQALQQSLDRRW